MNHLYVGGPRPLFALCSEALQGQGELLSRARQACDQPHTPHLCQNLGHIHVTETQGFGFYLCIDPHCHLGILSQGGLAQRVSGMLSYL